MKTIDLARAVEPIIADAIDARVFPGAVIEVGRAHGTLDTFAAGTQTYDHDSAPVAAETIYDLASLTKVIGTTALVAGEVASGRMRLHDRVRHWIAGWTGEERQDVTLRDRKSTRLNSSHVSESRMPSSA